MYQSYHLGILGRDNSFTSGEAVSEGIKNSLWVRRGTFQFPHEWHSRRGEIKIPHERRSREWGIFILPQLLCHEWGNWNVPRLTNREFFLSQNFQMIGFTFLLRSENFPLSYRNELIPKLMQMNLYLNQWKWIYT